MGGRVAERAGAATSAKLKQSLDARRGLSPAGEAGVTPGGERGHAKSVGGRGGQLWVADPRPRTAVCAWVACERPAKPRPRGLPAPPCNPERQASAPGSRGSDRRSRRYEGEWNPYRLRPRPSPGEAAGPGWGLLQGAGSGLSGRTTAPSPLVPGHFLGRVCESAALSRSSAPARLDPGTRPRAGTYNLNGYICQD
jgi:hypothetical protein